MSDRLKIYLDMDGCIADFHSRLKELKQCMVLENGQYQWCDMKFKDLVKHKQIFRHLDWMPNGKYLFDTLVGWHRAEWIDLEILSSCGTWDLTIAPLSADQKTHWLNERGGRHIKKNFVHSFACKANYATNKSILIDDRTDCYEGFVNAGGSAILYKDELCHDTLGLLKSILINRTQ